MLLDNHGTLTVGKTIGEAYCLMHLLERSAQAQMRAMAATGGSICVVSGELTKKTYQQWIGDGSEIDGDAEWPGLLRRVERC